MKNTLLTHHHHRHQIFCFVWLFGSGRTQNCNSFHILVNNIYREIGTNAINAHVQIFWIAEFLLSLHKLRWENLRERERGKGVEKEREWAYIAPIPYLFCHIFCVVVVVNFFLHETFLPMMTLFTCIMAKGTKNNFFPLIFAGTEILWIVLSTIQFYQCRQTIIAE